MNALSNNVLAVLFSWMRSLIQSVWGTISSGTSKGFWPWLGDHWMPLIVLLCVVCTVLDYLIWLIRWRPYILWRQWIRRLFHRKTADTSESDRDFALGYAAGVNLDFQDMQPPAEAEPENWDGEVYPASVPLEEIYPDPEPLGRFGAVADAPAEEEMPVPQEQAPRLRHRRSERHESRRRGIARHSPYAPSERNDDLNGNG